MIRLKKVRFIIVFLLHMHPPPINIKNTKCLPASDRHIMVTKCPIYSSSFRQAHHGDKMSHIFFKLQTGTSWWQNVPYILPASDRHIMVTKCPIYSSSFKTRHIMMTKWWPSKASINQLQLVSYMLDTYLNTVSSLVSKATPRSKQNTNHQIIQLDRNASPCCAPVTMELSTTL